MCPNLPIISPSLIRAETILSENPFWHHSKKIKKKSRPSSIDKDLKGSFFSQKQMTFRSAQRAKIRLSVFAPVCSNSQVAGDWDNNFHAHFQVGLTAALKGLGTKERVIMLGGRYKSWELQWSVECLMVKTIKVVNIFFNSFTYDCEGCIPLIRGFPKMLEC